VTCGPGATNIMTGVMGAWQDSIPMFVLTGQVRYAISVPECGLDLRYRGTQEYQVIPAAKHMTKYAATVTDPKAIKREINKAYNIMMDGRRGPVWLEIPQDIQSAIIEENDLKGDSIYEKTIEILKQNCLDDSAFEERLRGNLYKENVDATRYLLCSLAEHNMTDESNNTLWDRYGSGNYIWTIEHIFPEGENVPQEWVDMIADGDRSKAKEYLYEYTHKLGNLTMTGYNSALSNYSFEKKRDRTDKQGNYIGYKNHLSINADIANKEKWTIEDIRQRTDMLVNQLLLLFKL
jgi:hypothetical protein